jgi:hypothetical protein
MIPNNVKTATVTNNLGGKRIQMKFSKDAEPYLMALFTDLYSDQELACIREYSTNAWDSHLDAGQTRPIEVTTPTVMSPYLTIKDFGVGMDADVIEEVYSQYGESTKRRQTNTNGSMGIGAKAALSIASSFTITGVKDGIKTLVSVERGADGTGAMDIIAAGPTTEPNGVEIKIPAAKYNSYEEKAQKFFQFWKKGTVLLNGDDPTIAHPRVSDRIVMLPDGYNDVVVMGNVAYPVESAYRFSVGDQYAALFVTMNGADEIVFVPSREELMYNAKTKGVLIEARQEFEANVVDLLTKRLNSFTSYLEAYNEWSRITDAYPGSIVSKVSYAGPPLGNFRLTEDYADDGVVKTRDKSVIHWQVSKKRHAVTRGSVYFDTLLNKENRVIVNYRKSLGVSGADKARLREYFREHVGNRLGEQYYGGSTVILTSDSALPNKDRTSEVKVYDWKEILKVTRTPYSGGGGTSMNGQYEVWDGSGFVLDDITDEDEIVYWSEREGGPDRSMLVRFNTLYPNIKFVEAKANRHGKLARIAEKATHWLSFYKQAYAALGAEDMAKLTEDDFKVIAFNKSMDRYDMEAVLGINYWNKAAQISLLMKWVDKIDDTDYTDVVRVMAATQPYVGYATHHPDYSKRVSAHTLKMEKFVTKRYPLAYGNFSSDKMKDVVEYMNFRYAKIKENV